MPEPHGRQDIGVLALVDEDHPPRAPSGPREQAEDADLSERAEPRRLAAYRLGRTAARRALQEWRGAAIASAAEIVRGPLGQPLASVSDADVAEVWTVPGWVDTRNGCLMN